MYDIAGISTGGGINSPGNSGNITDDYDDDLSFKFTVINSAFKLKIAEGIIENKSSVDWQSFLLATKKVLFETITNIVQAHGAIKINARLMMEYGQAVYNRENTSNVTYENRHFGGRNGILYPISDLNEYFDEYIIKSIEESLEIYSNVGSGWFFSKVLFLHLTFFKHEPNNCGSFIKLPTFIANKGACINVNNSDNRCILYSIAASQHINHACDSKIKVKNPSRISNYTNYLNCIDMKDITYPMSLDQFDILEKNNQDFSFNVFVLKKEGIHNPKKKKKKILLQSILQSIQILLIIDFLLRLLENQKIIKQNT